MEAPVNPRVRTFWGSTHALDDLEEYDAQKAVNFGAFMVLAAHLGFHPSGEGAGSFECTSDDENARKEKPEVGVFGRERVRAVFAIVLRGDLDDREDERDQRVLEYLGPGVLFIVRIVY
jgi:hypothetical protein